MQCTEEAQPPTKPEPVARHEPELAPPVQSSLPADDEDEDDIGPLPPPTNGKRKATEAEQEEEDEFGFESDDEQEADRFPVSHEIVLKDHTKVSDQ
jgi:hypothetical protein